MYFHLKEAKCARTRRDSSSLKLATQAGTDTHFSQLLQSNPFPFSAAQGAELQTLTLNLTASWFTGGYMLRASSSTLQEKRGQQWDKQPREGSSRRNVLRAQLVDPGQDLHPP